MIPVLSLIVLMRCVYLMEGNLEELGYRKLSQNSRSPLTVLVDKVNLVELVGLALLGGVDSTYVIDSYRGQMDEKGTIAG
jgi:hypothetical protein